MINRRAFLSMLKIAHDNAIPIEGHKRNVTLIQSAERLSVNSNQHCAYADVNMTIDLDTIDNQEFIVTVEVTELIAILSCSYFNMPMIGLSYKNDFLNIEHFSDELDYIRVKAVPDTMKEVHIKPNSVPVMTIDAMQFKEQLTAVMKFSMPPKPEVRYYLNGINFKVVKVPNQANTQIEMCSTDGHKLMTQLIDTGLTYEDSLIGYSEILPSACVKFLSKHLLSVSNELLTIIISPNAFMFYFKGLYGIKFTYNCTAIDGKYPDYPRVVPDITDQTFSVTLNVKALIRKIELLMAWAKANDTRRGDGLFLKIKKCIPKVTDTVEGMHVVRMSVSPMFPEIAAALEFTELKGHVAGQILYINPSYFLKALKTSNLNINANGGVTIYFDEGSRERGVQTPITMKAGNGSLIIMLMRG